jgi:hypothetical protein
MRRRSARWKGRAQDEEGKVAPSQIEEEEIMKTKLVAILVSAVLSAAHMVYGQDTEAQVNPPALVQR